MEKSPPKSNSTYMRDLVRRNSSKICTLGKPKPKHWNAGTYTALAPRHVGTQTTLARWHVGTSFSKLWAIKFIKIWSKFINLWFITKDWFMLQIKLNQDLATSFFKQKNWFIWNKVCLRFKLFKNFQDSVQKQSTYALTATKWKSRVDDSCLISKSTTVRSQRK